MFKINRLQLTIILCALLAYLCSGAWGQEVYGPENLLRTLPTPFGPAQDKSPSKANSTSPNEMTMTIEDNGKSSSAFKLSLLPALGNVRPQAKTASEFNPIDMHINSRLPYRNISERLIQSHLYLPGRMVLGQPAEFTIKGKPGAMVALAMSEDDAGAKPIYGHPLKLGADRHVVSAGQIPDTGVIVLTIGTPIYGDLVGQHFYFEAAIWTKPDFSDVVFAEPVGADGQAAVNNAVSVAQDIPYKHGPKFTPTPALPYGVKEEHGLDSGKP